MFGSCGLDHLPPCTNIDFTVLMLCIRTIKWTYQCLHVYLWKAFLLNYLLLPNVQLSKINHFIAKMYELWLFRIIF